MAQVYFCPESPRWLIGKGRCKLGPSCPSARRAELTFFPPRLADVKAFKSLARLRHTKLQAARDLFMINALLEEEASISTGRPAIVELFAVARNRRAAVASGECEGPSLIDALHH